jgi:Holliday junction resolvasome RuvABC endonuclease subunit
MIVLGVDVPGKRSGGWAIYDSVVDEVIETDEITFHLENSELRTYQLLSERLDRLRKKHNFSIVALEHPFLHIIAQHIGAVKMWVALNPGTSWYMLTASSARKTVFGDAKKITRVTRTGSVVSGAKEFVLREMKKRYIEEGELTQHEADAILYAVAAARRLEAPAITRRKE